MIPKIIHFTVPRAMSEAQAETIRIARDLHPDWEVKVWQDPIDPAGFALSMLWEKANSGAQLADLVRLDVVHRFGGVYLDSDVHLKKRLDPIASHAGFFVCSEDGVRATNAVFGASAGHSVLKTLIDALLENPPDWSVPPNYTTGPEFFRHHLKWRGDVTLLPRAAFYPYNWDEAGRLEHPQTYGVHAWAASWKDERPASRLKSAARSWHPVRLAKAAYDGYGRFKRTNERAIRWFAPELRGFGMAPQLVRQTIHGHAIILDGQDVSVTPEIYRHGYYELREELFLGRALKGGDFFVDVGANVGAFSLLAAAKVGSFGRVFAYEPNPAVADLLRKSAAMNWMHERLVLRPAAVGAASGTANLVITPARLGDAALESAADEGGTHERTADYVGGQQRIAVPVVTLDEEFPYDIPIRMLKMDAEGYEPEVLQGADRLFRNNCIDLVMVEAIEEVAGRGWGRLMGALETVAGCGYEPFAFGRDGTLVPTSLARIRAAGGGQSRNIVLKRRGAEA